MEGDKSAKAGKATLDTILSTMERGFAAVANDIADIKSAMATKEDVTTAELHLDRRMNRLDAKIDRIDVKLTKFEENEIDKRLQLEVRVAAIGKHLGIDKSSSSCSWHCRRPAGSVGVVTTSARP